MSHKPKKPQEIYVGDTVKFERQLAYVEGFSVVEEDVYVTVSPPFIWQGKVQTRVKLVDVELVKLPKENIVVS